MAALLPTVHFPPHSSLRRPAAVNEQGLAGHVGTGIGRKEEDRAGQFGQFTPSAHGNFLNELLEADWIASEFEVHVGLEGTRAQGVDGDVARCPFQREGASQAEESGFGGSVGSSSCDSDRREDRAQMNNASPASLGHRRPEFAGHQEGSFQVRIDHIIPILDLKLVNRIASIEPRAVDQDIDLFDRGCDRVVKSIDLIGLSDIAAEGEHGSSIDAFEFVCYLATEFGIAADDDDRCSGLSQGFGKEASEPSRSAGDECEFAIELEGAG